MTRFGQYVSTLERSAVRERLRLGDLGKLLRRPALLPGAIVMSAVGAK